MQLSFNYTFTNWLGHAAWGGLQIEADTLADGLKGLALNVPAGELRNMSSLTVSRRSRDPRPEWVPIHTPQAQRLLDNFIKEHKHER